MYMAHYFHEHLEIDPILIAPSGQDFQEYAKNVTLIPPPEGARTLVYKNHTRNGHRTQQCENTESASPVSLTEEIKRQVAVADIICLAPQLPNFPAVYVQELLSSKRPGAMAVLLPQGYLRKVDAQGHILPRDFEEAGDVVPLFDLITLSEDDHVDTIRVGQQWAQIAPGSQIVVTQGPRGASWVTATGATTVETNPVPDDQIVDSVGCGDTFSAATMHNYFRSRDVVAAIKAGNSAARSLLFRTGSSLS
jgi:sugar/nucleoside kinase (ribokinase family)